MRILGITVFAFACIQSGCQQKSSAPLQFDAYEVDLGVVRGGTTIRREFNYVVSGGSDVAITDLLSSCQCTAASSGELGLPHRPGDNGVVALELNVDEYGGRFSSSVQVVTSPESKSPIVLRVHGTAWSFPRVTGVQPQFVEVPVGRPFEIDVKLVALSPQGEQSYDPDWNNSSLDGFVVASHQMSTLPLAPAGAQVVAGVREQHSLCLKHPAIESLGSIEKRIEIAWKGFEKRSEILVSVIVIHPLALSTPTIFLGFLKPGEMVDKSFSFASKAKDGLTGFVIERKDPGNTQASLTQEDSGLRIQVTAPEVPGRFTSEWTLLSNDPELPPLNIPVSGIVR
jgi:hypothetical protein